jgi:uncharacterized membrane protein
MLLLDVIRPIPGGRGVPAPGRPGGGGMLHGAGPALGHLLPLLFLVAMTLAVVLVVIALTRRPRVAHPQPMVSPVISELELRYARGEISREDFLQRRADLTGGPAPAATTPAAPSPPAAATTTEAPPG